MTPATITQDELRRAWSIQSDARRLADALNAIFDDFADRLAAGAAVEPGPHSIEREERRSGRERIVTIKVL